jgi:hypothetical protein
MLARETQGTGGKSGDGGMLYSEVYWGVKAILLYVCRVACEMSWSLSRWGWCDIVPRTLLGGDEECWGGRPETFIGSRYVSSQSQGSCDMTIFRHAAKFIQHNRVRAEERDSYLTNNSFEGQFCQGQGGALQEKISPGNLGDSGSLDIKRRTPTESTRLGACALASLWM